MVQRLTEETRRVLARRLERLEREHPELEGIALPVPYPRSGQEAGRIGGAA